MPARRWKNSRRRAGCASRRAPMPTWMTICGQRQRSGHIRRHPVPHVRSVLHHQAGRQPAPGSASACRAASWRRMAERSTLAASRRRGAGSCCDCRCAQASRPGRGCAVVTPAPAAREARSVLIVDDEAEVGRLLSEMLSGAGVPLRRGRAPARRRRRCWNTATTTRSCATCACPTSMGRRCSPGWQA